MNNEYMRMLRNSVLAPDTMRAGALQAGYMAGALEGGRVNTKGAIYVKKRNGQPVPPAQPKGAAQFTSYIVPRILSLEDTRAKLGRPSLTKAEYAALPFASKSYNHSVTYDEYLHNFESRRMSNEVNDQVLSAKIAAILHEKNANLKVGEKPHHRIGGEQLVLLKYRTRNGTKNAKRKLKAQGIAAPTAAQLMNPLLRGKAKGLRGKMSQDEKDYRARERARIDAMTLSGAERKAALHQAYEDYVNRPPRRGEAPEGKHE
jgi:hypothetical protein